MTFEYVSRVPPEGGAEQEMLCVGGASFRLDPIMIPDDGAMMFSVWCKADTPTQIEVIGASAQHEIDVPAAWRRVSVGMEEAGEIAIAVGADAEVLFYRAQLEAGNRVTDWRPAPEDADTEIAGARSVANAVRDDFHRVVRVDGDGLHVGDNLSGGEVLIDSESMNVVLNGIRFSKFASNYVQFGNYQLRRSADGGLAFKLKEG